MSKTAKAIEHTPTATDYNDSQKVVKLANWLESHVKTLKKTKKATVPTDLASKIITDQKVLAFMQHYVTADREQSRGEVMAGEIYWLYFRADPQTQSSFIDSIASANNVTVPVDRTPRRRLILALYGRDADLVDDGSVGAGGSKYDSKGGKRVTYAIRTFMQHAGLKPPRKDRSVELYPRRTKKFLAELYSVATAAEITLLNKLIARKFGKKALPHAA